MEEPELYVSPDGSELRYLTRAMHVTSYRDWRLVTDEDEARRHDDYDGSGNDSNVRGAGGELNRPADRLDGQQEEEG